MFRIIISAVLLTGQLFLYYRFAKFVDQLIERFHPLKKIGLVLFIFFNAALLVIAYYFWRLSDIPRDVQMLLYPVYIWHIATLFIFFALLIAELFKLPFVVIFNVVKYIPFIGTKVSQMADSPRFKSLNASRRAFLQKGFVGLSAYSFVGATAGTITEGDYEIVNTTVTIPNLPDEFKGFRIGMMSDLHSSIFMNKEDMDVYVKAMNDLKTDLVVVTGDFVNSQTQEVYQFAEAFSNLKAPNGVYGCLGNHDYFTKNVDLVAKEVDGCGVKLLRNDAIKIQKGNSFFNLLGVDDIGRSMDPNDYFSKALAFAKNNNPKILLCHKPYYFEQATKLGIDLTLSGHTHGGQIVFGTVDQTPISLATLASKYVSGLYTINSSHLYVNNGIGFTGLPIRINCPAELTVLTLA